VSAQPTPEFKSAAALFNHLHDIGVRLNLGPDGTLRPVPGFKITPDLETEIGRFRAELIAMISGTPPSPTPLHPHRIAVDAHGIVGALADAIGAADFFAVDAGGRLYRYCTGVYHADGERHVAHRAQELLEEWGERKRWSTHRATEVAAYLATAAPTLWERPSLDMLNVENGLLDISDPVHPRLIEHSPDYLSDVQLPITYDPTAVCREWEAFSAATLPEDAQDLLFEIAADLMTPERSEQKAILLTGEGSNGKSVALTALTAFIGKRNTASLSLHKLEESRFATTGLLGKLANVCADLPSAHLTGTSVFKTVTGGDAIEAEYKYGTAFAFHPFSRLVFSANHPPRSEDASHAFFRRWLVVPFDKTFEGKAAVSRKVLDARLADPRELSGVLNRAVALLPRLRAHGFTETPSMRAAWQEFREVTDPFSVWLDTAVVRASRAFVRKNELLAAFNRHNESSGRPMTTATGFSLALKRAIPGLTDAQKEFGDGKKWVWLGIGLGTPPSPTDPPPAHGSHGSHGLPLLFQEKEKNNDNNRQNRVNRVTRDEDVPDAMTDTSVMSHREMEGWTKDIASGWGSPPGDLARAKAAAKAHLHLTIPADATEMMTAHLILAATKGGA